MVEENGATYLRYSKKENDNQEFYICENWLSNTKGINCYQHTQTQGILLPWAFPEESIRKWA